MKNRLLDTKVRYFHRDCMQAKLSQSKWESLIEVLDEALVNGSPPINVTMFKTVEDPDGYWVTTVTTESEHNYTANVSVVTLSGSSESKYNSTFRVQETPSNNEFTIAFSKEVVTESPESILNAESTSVRLAPLGYSKLFSAEYKAVYRSPDTSTDHSYLRVDCTPIPEIPSMRFARVSIYEDMKSVDDYAVYSGKTKVPYNPTRHALAEEGYREGPDLYTGWTKWYYIYESSSNTYTETGTFSSNSNPSVAIIGDDKTFYLFIKGIYRERQPEFSGNSYPLVYAFGKYQNKFNKTTKNSSMLVASEGLMNTKQSMNGNSAVSHDNNRYDSGTNFEINSNMTRAVSTAGKFMFNNESPGGTLEPSATFSLYADSIRVSGLATHVSFNQYYTEVNLSKVKMLGRYPGKTVALGEMRGLYWVQNNLRGLRPQSFSLNESVLDNIKEHPEKKFFCLSTGADLQESSITFFFAPLVFELGDWEQ